MPSLPPLPSVSIPVNLTPPSGVLSLLSSLTSGVPQPPPAPPAVTNLILQLLASIPALPFPTL